MRWILAGIAFALLVTLAVVTVVIKVGNRQTQGRLEHLSTGLILVQVERARQAEWYFAQASEPHLLKRLRELFEGERIGLRRDWTEAPLD